MTLTRFVVLACLLTTFAAQAPAQQDLRATLFVEADQMKTSVNQLCISKLIQWIDKERVPTAPEEERPKAKIAEEAPAIHAHTPEYAGASMAG